MEECAVAQNGGQRNSPNRRIKLGSDDGQKEERGMFYLDYRADWRTGKRTV